MPNSIKKLEEAFKEGKYDQLLKLHKKAWIYQLSGYSLN